MKEYVNKVVVMIGAKMIEKKLKCDYCDHNQNRTLKPRQVESYILPK